MGQLEQHCCLIGCRFFHKMTLHSAELREMVGLKKCMKRSEGRVCPRDDNTCGIVLCALAGVAVSGDQCPMVYAARVREAGGDQIVPLRGGILRNLLGGREGGAARLFMRTNGVPCKAGTVVHTSCDMSGLGLLSASGDLHVWVVVRNALRRRGLLSTGLGAPPNKPTS